MSRWLSRAKEALGGREAEIAPEPIEISCLCGVKVQATRHPTFQRILCKGCGESFFLLPQDVYPRPVMKVRKLKPPKSTKTATSKSSDKSEPVSQPAARPESAESRINIPAMLTAAGARIQTQFTPLRLIVLSLLAVIGLTGWWQWNRAARSAADRDFKTACDAGMADLQKSDYVGATQHFSRASAAADILHRTDAAAQQARQRFRQLTVLNSLVTRSVLEMIEAARATRLRENVVAAESEFASLHAGRWLVLQSEIIPPADPATSASPSWEQRIQVYDESLILTATLPVFSKVLGAAPLPAATTDAAPISAAPPGESPLNDLGQREIVFAAQVESLKWNADKSAWVLNLQATSGFLWTDYDLLLAAGLPPDELHSEARLRAMLTEQSRWIGAIE